MEVKLYTQSIGYARWVKAEIVNSPEKANLILFKGGADLNPALYGEKDAGHRFGQRVSHFYDRTDEEDLQLFEFAKKHQIPTLGICRGGQLQTIMAGGKLIQDVTNHAGGRHPIKFADGDILPVPSLHHQMFRPGNIEHSVLAWATPRLSEHYLTEQGLLKTEEVPIEPEVVYYPTINGLAIQGHPEMSSNQELHDKLNHFIKFYLYGKE